MNEVCEKFGVQKAIHIIQFKNVITASTSQNNSEKIVRVQNNKYMRISHFV
jgi:hypothetical protein